MATATGADVPAIIRLVFAARALGNAALTSVPIYIGTPICASGSASVADLSTRYCPLPLAADDADFMSGLFFLGYGSDSIGFDLDPCDVDAALLSILCSHLCISSANASSLLRSNVSAPCGDILRCNLGIQQRLRIIQCLAFVILSLWFSVPSNGNGGIGIGSTPISGVSTDHQPSVILLGTPITLVASLVPFF